MSIQQRIDQMLSEFPKKGITASVDHAGEDIVIYMQVDGYDYSIGRLIKSTNLSNRALSRTLAQMIIEFMRAAQ